MFAVHPLHVESVAWVAERKDVLSACFWFLTLHAYVSYARRPSAGRYAATAGVFAAGLLAKPMLVTLPVVLLLVDMWPLERRALGARRLLLEKAPLLALALVSSILTVVAQHRGGAVGRLLEFPLSHRLANAAVTTIAYLQKAVWPASLSVHYPYPERIPAGAAIVCVALIIATTAAVIRGRRARPYLAFGWLWYLVTLVPVIGLVQVGTQGMADRYTYIPLVGPFIALAFWVPPLTGRVRALRVSAAFAVMMLLTYRAHAQAAYWRDSVTLFEHALRLNADNAVAHSNLGRAYLERGDLERSLTHAREVVRIDPGAPDGEFNLGVVLERLGHPDEAAAAYRAAIRIAPAQASPHLNLGILLAGAGDVEAAEAELREAVRLEPDSFAARNNLGVVLAGRGALQEAVVQFAEAVRLDPVSAEARSNLERARSASPL
jgi:Flp pilus assembly protein TadD